jgi:hypothetical protein
MDLIVTLGMKGLAISQITPALSAALVAISLSAEQTFFSFIHASSNVENKVWTSDYFC